MCFCHLTSFFLIAYANFKIRQNYHCVLSAAAAASTTQLRLMVVCSNHCWSKVVRVHLMERARKKIRQNEDKGAGMPGRPKIGTIHCGVLT